MLTPKKLCVLATLCAVSVYGQVSGNINPATIEIDADANLYPNAAGFVDWVKDSAPNTDPATLVDSIATGIIPGVTGATGGSGHWYGVRIVDGIAGSDQDIFLTGGKENDLSTWNVGPGSVGSSKYDITQAYLANNATTLFFGMERRGNNGTTAFDFEFNVNAPAAGSYVPTRTVGDVLFTFEMQGSGGSGSATPHYYIWDGAQYAEQTPPPASLVSSINNSETAAAPWGYVNSKGEWVLGNLPRFEFAEASVLLSEAFPGFVACNSRAFVQVRTRSSSTATSDLKDTTKIFEYIFGGPVPAAAYDTSCLAQFTYTSAGSTDSTGGNNISFLWSFTAPAGVTLSGSGISGPDANGTYSSSLASGTVNVSFPAGVQSATIDAFLTVFEGTECETSTETVAVTVFRPLTVAITQKDSNGTALSVTLHASSNGATSYQWQRLSAGTWVNIAGQTGSTLTYTSFETDATPTVQSFVIDGAGYAGKLYQVQSRVRAFRTQDGEVCDATSAPVTVKKVVAVDP
jgi:hypothetical protein